jgi:hypothetical protein
MAQISEASRHKELDIIQDVVIRLAANSFQVKTWMMGIVTAILAFKNEEIFSAGKTVSNAGLWISLVLLFPVIMFWYLDAFFLRNERLYRELYKWVVINRPFSDKYLFDLNTFEREDFENGGTNKIDLVCKIENVGGTMLRKTLLWFYAIPLILIIALVLYNLLPRIK